ncbi:PREDICTED: TRIO and F-actin-binding protein-like [Myotis brandtii]|uniref:TRIO and F-actin-binding protein-like n=1 Tax=Myotis brandtii TaxID=109478 RepID=UPI0007044882|nr:PREDICTED: TRIO and F-actin-binding protein-like [Myotis brandtii]
MVCSSSLGSLDVASQPPAHVDSSSPGGRGAERLGCTFAFKASRQYAALADVPKAIRISHREAFQVERRRLERRTRARSPGREEVARLFGYERRSCPSPPSPAVLLCDVTRPSSAASLPSQLRLQP